MPRRIGNFGDWRGDRPSDKPGHGYHPPACTCFGCIEKRHRAEERSVAARLDAQLRQGTGITTTTEPQPTKPSKSRTQSPPKKVKKTKKRFWPFGGAMLACLVVSMLIVAAVGFGGIERPGFLEGRGLPGLGFLGVEGESDQGITPTSEEEQEPSVPSRMWRRTKVFAWSFWQWSSVVPLYPEEIEYWIVHYTNEERALALLPPLEHDPELSAMAIAHSKNMAEQDNLSHVLDGQGAGDRMRTSGNGCFLGGAENIVEYPHSHEWMSNWEGDSSSEWHAAAYTENARLVAKGMVKSWMWSPEHRKNMLSKRWRSIGVGAAHTPEGIGGLAVISRSGVRSISRRVTKGEGTAQKIPGEPQYRRRRAPYTFCFICGNDFRFGSSMFSTHDNTTSTRSRQSHRHTFASHSHSYAYAHSTAKPHTRTCASRRRKSGHGQPPKGGRVLAQRATFLACWLPV